jgi:hypothetical protein
MNPSLMPPPTQRWNPVLIKTFKNWLLNNLLRKLEKASKNASAKEKTAKRPLTSLKQKTLALSLSLLLKKTEM